MNLNYFKTFYYTAKLGSITNAATALNITQPAASRQIQELQNAYSIMLFDKAGKKMVLTDAGKILFSLAEKMIEIETEIEKSIKDYKNQKSGTIRIMATDTFGNYYLPEMIFLFNRMFSEIQISINFSDTEDIIRNISLMKTDIGFTNKPVDNEEIISTKIIDDRFILAVQPGCEFSDLLCFTPENIENKNFITFQKGTEDRNIFDNYLTANSITSNIVCEVSSYHAMKEFIKKGIGYGFVPKNAINSEIEDGTLIAVPEKENILSNSFYLLNHRDKFFNKGLHVFREIVMKWASFYSKGLLDNSQWDNYLI